MTKAFCMSIVYTIVMILGLRESGAIMNPGSSLGSLVVFETRLGSEMISRNGFDGAAQLLSLNVNDFTLFRFWTCFVGGPLAGAALAGRARAKWWPSTRETKKA